MKTLRIMTIALLALGVFAFSSCDEVSNEVEVLAGFIEIEGDTLRITPVDVFIIDGPYTPDIVSRGTTVFEMNDVEAMAEYGLTPYDFPSGMHIRPNWHAELGWHYVEQANIKTLTFRLTDETVYEFVDSGLLFNTDPYGDRRRVTTAVEEFLEYLYPAVVHFVEVQGDRVIRVVQEFGFTM